MSLLTECLEIDSRLKACSCQSQKFFCKLESFTATCSRLCLESHHYADKVPKKMASNSSTSYILVAAILHSPNSMPICLHITIYCWLVLRYVSAWLNRQPPVQQVGTEILWILYSSMGNTTPHLTEGIMVGLWRDFWIRETGTGQQVAQLHERYMMMMMMMMMMMENL